MKNKEIREKILIIVTDNYTDTHYDEVHEPVVDQIMQIVEEERERAILAYLRDGMFFDGWKIEVTHRDGEKVHSSRRLITKELAESSLRDVFVYNLEIMLSDLSSLKKV